MSATILADAENLAYRVTPELHSLAQIPARAQGITSSAAQATIHHYHHHDSFWATPHYFSQPVCYTTSYPYYGSSRRNKKEDNTFLIGTLAAIATLVASYFLGKDFGMMTAANRKERTLDIQVQTLGLTPSTKLQKVIDLEKKILADQHETAKTGLMLKGVLAASTAAVGLGAVFAAPVAVTAGLVGAGASTTALILRQGYLDANTTVRENGSQLLQAVVAARA